MQRSNAQETKTPLTENATGYCENGHKFTGPPFAVGDYGQGCLEPSCRHHICILVDRFMEPEIPGYICALHKHTSPLSGKVGTYLEGCDGTGVAKAYCGEGHFVVHRPSQTQGRAIGCIHPICYHAVGIPLPSRNTAERKMAGTPPRAKSNIKIEVPHGGPGRMPARYWLQKLASKEEDTAPEGAEEIISVSPMPGFEVRIVNSSVVTSLPRQEANLSATSSTEVVNDNDSTTTNREEVAEVVN